MLSTSAECCGRGLTWWFFQCISSQEKTFPSAFWWLNVFVQNIDDLTECWEVYIWHFGMDFFVNDTFCILNPIAPKFVSRGLFHNTKVKIKWGYGLAPNQYNGYMLQWCIILEMENFNNKWTKREKTGYRKVSNIRRTKFQNISDSRPVLQLSLSNLLKPYIKSRMKM